MTEHAPNVDEDAPTPEEVAAVRAMTVQSRGFSLDALVMTSPGRALEVVKARIDSLGAIRAAALSATCGNDWVLMRPKDGPSSAMLKASGAQRIRKFYGISIQPQGDIRVLEEDGVRYAEAVGDAYCALTGEMAERLVGRRGEKEKFIGRAMSEAGLGDLRQAARTSLETKAVRILAGMSGVDPAEIAAAWKISSQEVERRCSRGSGFGSSADRQAAGKAPERAPSASVPVSVPSSQGGAVQSPAQGSPGPAAADTGKTIGGLMRQLYGDKTDWTDFRLIIKGVGADWPRELKWAGWLLSLTPEKAAAVIGALRARLGEGQPPPADEPPQEPPRVREPGEEG